MRRGPQDHLRIANDLRGSVDGWDFKTYVLGILFYRFISENLSTYINQLEREAGDAAFDYAQLPDDEAEWFAFVTAKRDSELDAIIADENLRADATREFIAAAFRDGALVTTGTAITTVLPPASRFAPDGGHGERKRQVIAKLAAFFDRFFSLTATGLDEE